MNDHSSSEKTSSFKQKNCCQRPNRSPSPSPMIKQPTNSWRHPYAIEKYRRTNTDSSNSSPFSNSSNVHSTIQMEPGLQALLLAEGHALEMIATARAKRNALLKQVKQDSQTEIEAFRQERELKYRNRLHEATQLEHYKAKLSKERFDMLMKMEENVKNKQQPLVNYIVHCVIEQIPVEPHRNAKRSIS